MKRLHCWWDGFYWTWLSPSTWMVRIRLLLTPQGPPLRWPGIVESGHLHDTEHPRFVVEGDREHEYTTCARCGVELYEGWRQFYGAPLQGGKR